MDELITNEEYAEIVSEQRHEELIKTLRILMSKVNEVGKVGELVPLLEQHNRAVEAILLAIKSQPPADFSKLETNILRGLKTIKDSIPTLPEQVKEWRFEITRDRNGYITSGTFIAQ